MKITEIHINRASTGNKGRLLAHVKVVLDYALVVQDLKIIQGVDRPFLAMPSRRVQDNCPQCQQRNILEAGWCNYCGHKMDPRRSDCPMCEGDGYFETEGEELDCRECKGRGGRPLYVDIVFPITQQMRRYWESVIFGEYSRMGDRSYVDVKYQEKEAASANYSR